jgi:hypothetical protein
MEAHSGESAMRGEDDPKPQTRQASQKNPGFRKQAVKKNRRSGRRFRRPLKPNLTLQAAMFA